MSGLPPVAILAGGLATRLRPETETIPKARVEVAGRPFLAWQLELLARSDIREAVLCCGYRGEQIEAFAVGGAAFGLRVRYSFDGARLLGTAGAIRNALPLLGPEFFVLYGDSYLECDYGAVAEAFARSGKQALMTVYRNEEALDRSNVEFADGAIRVYDKRRRTAAMRHIDYGLGVFRASAFAAVPEGEPADLADVYAALLAKGELAAFEVGRQFYEVGSPDGLAEFRAYMARRTAG